MRKAHFNLGVCFETMGKNHRSIDRYSIHEKLFLIGYLTLHREEQLAK